MTAKDARKNIPQQPQRQDSLEDQLKSVAEAVIDHDIEVVLREVHGLANRIGCYDAADWLARFGVGDGNSEDFASIVEVARSVRQLRAMVDQ